MRRGIAGEIPYSQWFAGDIAMLRDRGANRRAIQQLLSKLKPADGAEVLVRDLRARGVRVAVVSGGIELILEAVLPTLVFDEVFINRLRFDDAGALIGGSPTPYDRGGKADALRLLAERYDVDVADTAFVGDGANDHAIMEAAGLGIAWGPSPPQSLLDLATHHRQGDMRQLLELLTH